MVPQGRGGPLGACRMEVPAYTTNPGLDSWFRAHKIKYRIPAVIDDHVVVQTWIETMEKVSSDRRYHIVRKSDGKRLAEAETTWVYVNWKRWH